MPREGHSKGDTNVRTRGSGLALAPCLARSLHRVVVHLALHHRSAARRGATAPMARRLVTQQSRGRVSGARDHFLQLLEVRRRGVHHRCSSRPWSETDFLQCAHNSAHVQTTPQSAPDRKQTTQDIAHGAAALQRETLRTGFSQARKHTPPTPTSPPSATAAGQSSHFHELFAAVAFLSSAAQRHRPRLGHTANTRRRRLRRRQNKESTPLPT